MLARRGTRALLTALAVTLAVVGLAGCRTSPDVAAYVGPGTISVTQLNDAVAAREQSDTTVAAYAHAHTTQYTQQVLGYLVTQRVYTQVAQRYGVQVDDGAVRARITQLLAGNDPAQVYGQLAQQGISRADVFENVRQQLVRQQVAAKKGLAGALSDAALQARYQQVKDSLAQREFGYITVPDQATAQSVLAQLTANPAAYPALAAQYAGSYTVPTLQPRTTDQIPAQIASQVASAQPNTGFTVPLQQSGGVVVVFVGNSVVPTFEQAKPQLQQEAQTAVDGQAQKLVDQVRSGLHITVNPRYGVLKSGTVTAPTGGVVDILGSSSASAPASAPAGPSGTPGS